MHLVGFTIRNFHIVACRLCQLCIRWNGGQTYWANFGLHVEWNMCCSNVRGPVEFGDVVLNIFNILHMFVFNNGKILHILCSVELEFSSFQVFPNRSFTSFRFLRPCIMSVGWSERNQQDATIPMFITKLLSQHVSDIIMPIIRRTRPCTTAYGVPHWLCWLWLAVVVWSCVVGCVHCVKSKSNLHTVHTAHDAGPHNHSQLQPAQPVRNAICVSKPSCSPDDVRNMLR